MKKRVHLRHTGDRNLRFGIQELWFSWGYNLYFGRLFLAIRERKDGEVPRPFWDLEMGLGLRRARLARTSEYDLRVRPDVHRVFKRKLDR